MKAGTLVIRILAILLQFGALNADDSTQYAGCHRNFTSSTGSVSEGEFSGLSCPEHEIRIQAGVPIVFTCQDLVLEVGSQQYCASIGGIKQGKKNKDKHIGFGKHRIYNLDGNDSNNGGKTKHDRKPNIKSSFNSYAEDSVASWKRRSKRDGAGQRSNVSGNDSGKVTEMKEKKSEKMEAKLGQTKAPGKGRMAQSPTTQKERTKGRLENLKNSDNQNMAKPKYSNTRKNKKNKNKLEKLTSRLQKYTTTIGKLEKKITKLQDKTNAGSQVAKLQKKVNKLKSKSEKLQNKIDDLQPLLGTTVGLTDDTNGNGYTNNVSDDNHDDTNDTDNSDEDNGDDSPDGDNDNDDTNDPDHLDDADGDNSPDGDGDDDDRPRIGNWPGPKNEGIGKPKRQWWGNERKENFGNMGKGGGRGNGKEQSFCGPQVQPITINSQTGEIGLSVRPKGPKTGSGRKPSKPHHSGSGSGTHGAVTQDPAGAAVVMIPSEVKYTCSWSPASP